MWLDAQAAFAELAGVDVPPTDPPMSKSAHRDRAEKPQPRVAQVAGVARTPALHSESSQHGMTLGDAAKTWTGRVVSLDDCCAVIERERHRSKGWV